MTDLIIAETVGNLFREIRSFRNLITSNEDLTRLEIGMIVDNMYEIIVRIISHMMSVSRARRENIAAVQESGSPTNEC